MLRKTLTGFAALALAYGGAGLAHARETGRDPALPTPPLRTENIAVLASPDIERDGRVTFRVQAPNARKVELVGDILDQNANVRSAGTDSGEGDEPSVEFTNKDGVWTGTTRNPVKAGAYQYLFKIDGLLTTDINNPSVSLSASQPFSLLLVPGDFSEARAVPHGALSQIIYTTTDYGPEIQRTVYVYTPPGYEKGQQRYPVLYLLHGYGDTASTWTTVGRANFIMDNLIAQDRAVPMMIVMLSGWTPGRNQIYTLDAHKDPFNKELIGTIVPMIDRRFRTIDQREGRAIAGLSAGGTQTLALGFGNIDTFASILPMSTGWFQAADDKTFVKINADAIAHADRQLKLFWWGWGVHDIAKENGLRSMSSLESAGVTKIVKFETTGGHDWGAWRSMLHEYGQLLFR